ncbi:MAG: hypothetical protein RL376_835 [Verrucomicrobiota bacterium]|jgi:hypothetical protein
MPSSFATARRLRTLHLLVQAVLLLALVFGLNYLATKHAWRFDLSRHARHSLSPETRSYLRELSAPVKIVVTLSENTDDDVVAQASRDVKTLLRDYVEASAANPRAPIAVEFVDVYQNRAAAQRLGIDKPNTILVASGPKTRTVGLDELYEVQDREKTGFKGEQAFTAAILDVSRSGKQPVFFLTSHGEMDPNDTDPARGLSLLRDELALRNFDLAILDLSNPADRARVTPSSLLIIASPQGRYSPDEQEFLRRHLSASAGRILALLNPANPHGLDELLFDWGILADDVVILDQSAEGRSDTGDLILYPTTSEHPVIEFLASNKIAVRFGPSRSVRPDPGRSLDPGLNTLPLLATSPGAWGERSYRQRGPAAFDPAADLAPPLAVGTAAERVAPKDKLPFSVRSGRLIVYGGGEWLANARLAAGGNLSLALASINWLVDRDTLLQLPPRPIEKFQLSLNTVQLGRLRLSLLFALPALAATLGLLVYWSRRR